MLRTKLPYTKTNLWEFANIFLEVSDSKILLSETGALVQVEISLRKQAIQCFYDLNISHCLGEKFFEVFLAENVSGLYNSPLDVSANLA